MLRVGASCQRDAACEWVGYDPHEWRAHDGVLSVCGQAAPLGEATSPLPDSLKPAALSTQTRCGGKGGDGSADARLAVTPSTSEVCAREGLAPGIWHTMQLDVDHFSVCGGPLASPPCIDAFWSMYVQMRDERFISRRADGEVGV